MTDVSNPTPTPTPTPAPTALPPHIAALSPADQATALASLVKAGRPLPVAPAPNDQPTPSPTPAGASFSPTSAYKTNEAMSLWDRMDKSDPARVERFRQAMIADTGVDPQTLTQTPEQRAYMVPARPDGYDLHLDPSITTSDPAGRADYQQSFSQMAHSLELPSPVAAVLANDILDAVGRFENMPQEDRDRYFGSNEGDGVPHSVKNELAKMFDPRGDWETAKPQIQAALKPVWQRMSEDDRAELLSSGALSDYRVLHHLVVHGRVLALRAADKGQQQ